MSAVEALNAARAEGVELTLEGEDLVLSAAAAPSEAVIDALSRHKAGIVALLRPDNWSSDDWLAFYDERAGVAEFDGGLQRAAAEERAFECCVVEWLNRNPAQSPPDRCLHCGSGGDVLLPYGTETAAWLHPRCWNAWHANRRATAVAALSSLLRKQI
ncbi:hypothetical protein [Bradyrhizobium sp. USDA 3650]